MSLDELFDEFEARKRSKEAEAQHRTATLQQRRGESREALKAIVLPELETAAERSRERGYSVSVKQCLDGEGPYATLEFSADPRELPAELRFQHLDSGHISATRYVATTHSSREKCDAGRWTPGDLSRDKIKAQVHTFMADVLKSL